MQKLLPKNKKGIGVLGVFLIVFSMVVLVVGGLALGGVLGGKQTTVDDNGEPIEVEERTCPSDQPTVDVIATDPLSGGAVTIGADGIVNQVKKDGIFSQDANDPSSAFIGPVTFGASGTEFEKGDDVVLLIGGANYINKTVEIKNLKCGVNRVSADIYATDSGALDLLDDTLNKVTDDAIGGATNITSASGSLSFIVDLRGVTDQYTGDLLVTLEGNDTQIDTFEVSGNNIIDAEFGEGTTYTLFSAEGTSPTVKMAFVVGGLLSGRNINEKYTVTLNPEAGKTIGAGTLTSKIYANVYSAQACVDIVDGKSVFRERCWEDTRGTLMAEDTWTDHDALIE